jgi:tetratricopeptide (TPR) repeat protein
MTADVTKKASEGRSACSEWLADLQELIALARDSFGEGDFEGAAECCRQANKNKRLSDDIKLACEIYYIWCLANLKTGNLDEVIQACAEAREKLGEYLDLAYFELIASIMKGEPERVLSLAQHYLKLWNNEKQNNDPLKSRTGDRVGEVLLMLGQVLEQMHRTGDAIEIYKKYLVVYPEDKAIEDRLAQMSVSDKT